MSRSKPVVVPLHQLQPGQVADTFALLAEKTPGRTRDGKPFVTCKFKDVRRTVESKVWADSPHFEACAEWVAGQHYKIRGLYTEHERYGPQLDVQHIREVNDTDRADGFRESDFAPCSRFDPKAMFAELRALAEAEVKGDPLRRLVLALLDEHADAIQKLPAHPRAFFPYPGGWLEHTLSVLKSSLFLTDRYLAHYPELTPPLNRDLVIASATLHEIGRVAELVPGPPGHPPEPTVKGRLFGPILLARDLIRDAAAKIPELDAELLTLLEHVVVTHLSLPEWGSPRLPAIPEVLILHHADDLDAKMEMYVRCLLTDASEGPFTDSDPILKKPLLKDRKV